MFSTKCPGQDTRYWKNEDIYETPCPFCDSLIEFWKTDVRVRCPNCNKKVVNSKFNLGCAKWCIYAEQCLGPAVKGLKPVPLKDTLKQSIKDFATGKPEEYKNIINKLDLIDAESKNHKFDLLPVLIATSFIMLKNHDLVADEKKYLEMITGKHKFPAEIREKTITIINNINNRNISGINEKIIFKNINNKN